MEDSIFEQLTSALAGKDYVLTEQPDGSVIIQPKSGSNWTICWDTNSA